MWYEVLADCGEYQAGQVLDIGDPEYALLLIRSSGVKLQPVDGPVSSAVEPAAQEPVAEPVAEPKPAVAPAPAAAPVVQPLVRPANRKR